MTVDAPRVAYIGNFHHPHCTEVHIANALRSLDCTVAEVHADHAVAERGVVVKMLREGRFDLILYTRTHSRHMALDQSWGAVWRRLEQAGAATASFHLDRFWDLERETLIHRHDALFTTGYVFTADGGNQPRWEAAGVNHRWLPPAAPLESCDVARRRAGQARPVVFAGSVRYHNEYPQRTRMIRLLAERYGRSFKVYGPDSRNTVRGVELGRLYRSAHIVVGDSCFANSADRSLSQNYWSDRIPETLGRGGFLIHPDVDGLDASYMNGVDLVTYPPGDFDALFELIDRYLEEQPAARRIADAGHARVLAEHTYRHRMAVLLYTVGLRENAEVAA